MYAPGIPSKTTSHELPTIEKPTTWQFVIHDHHADRRGQHYDLRLGDPETGRAHSWAMPPKWPEPGESSWAIQQPTHTVKYMDFEGRIEDGYGKGDVFKKSRDKVEITSARPGHINFNIYRGTGPEEYTLHRIADNKWKLLNRTLHRQKLDLPDSKPKYKEVKVSQAQKYLENPDVMASAKIDDAHNLFILPASGEPVRVISYRPSKRSPYGIIEHTHKVPSLFGLKTPSGMGGTILRGGIYAMDPQTGIATLTKDLAGLLNSNVWDSREKQKKYGELLPVLYDVVSYKGKNMENAPYADKLKVLREVADKLPFDLPRMAFGTEEKKKLLADIRSGQVPETKEGVVFWNLKSGEAPTKAKFTTDHDVVIRDFFPGEGKYRGNGVGGFLYSHEPWGPVVGRVGTGLSDALRRDMHSHPERYKGLTARVTAQDKFHTGALRAPSFQGWHLDKNEPAMLAQVKMASLDLALLFIWEPT